MRERPSFNDKTDCQFLAMANGKLLLRKKMLLALTSIEIYGSFVYPIHLSILSLYRRDSYVTLVW